MSAMADNRPVGPGRKPKRPEERRRNRVMLNLTDAEYRALLDASGGRAPSDYVRNLLIRHLKRRR
jgi:hypothetical protein